MKKIERTNEIELTIGSVNIGKATLENSQVVVSRLQLDHLESTIEKLIELLVATERVVRANGEADGARNADYIIIKIETLTGKPWDKLKEERG